MQESGAKRPDKLLQRNSTEENDRADTSSSACQVGDADGDVPAHPSKTTELAQTPESSQETAIITKQEYDTFETPYIKLQIQEETLEDSDFKAVMCARNHLLMY